jgi:hypothetical protein
MRLNLDSSVVIDAGQCGGTVERLIEPVVAAASDREARLSAVGLTASSTASIERTLRPLSPVLPRRVAGRLDLFSDLLIGATARPLGSSVLTANVPHFRQVRGLSLFR